MTMLSLSPPERQSEPSSGVIRSIPLWKASFLLCSGKRGESVYHSFYHLESNGEGDAGKKKLLSTIRESGWISTLSPLERPIEDCRVRERSIVCLLIGFRTEVNSFYFPSLILPAQAKPSNLWLLEPVLELDWHCLFTL